MENKDHRTLQHAVRVLRNLDAEARERLRDAGCQPDTALGTLEEIVAALAKVTEPTVAEVNRAIRYLNLKLVAGKGYYYFLHRETGDQVGDSVPVYRCKQLPLDRWVDTAEQAVADARRAR